MREQVLMKVVLAHEIHIFSNRPLIELSLGHDIDL